MGDGLLKVQQSCNIIITRTITQTINNVNINMRVYVNSFFTISIIT